MNDKAARSVSLQTRLKTLVQRMQPQARWDDLVLPEAQKQILREIAVQVRQRQRVDGNRKWFAKDSRRFGVSALFFGESGTGKTLAAEVLASELRVDSYRIDLSRVVSKYVGETEKNLSRVFDAAEEGGAILLFDEAEALFGGRSEVKDSHDRFANGGVGYLLERMEEHQGLTLLTTNRKETVDEAFLRRIHFVVPFPFPDAAHRAEIWRRVLPASGPTSELDLSRLATLNVSGGEIRDIALHAASLAGDAQVPLSIEHLFRAASSECANRGRPRIEVENRGRT